MHLIIGAANNSKRIRNGFYKTKKYDKSFSDRQITGNYHEGYPIIDIVNSKNQ